MKISMSWDKQEQRRVRNGAQITLLPLGSLFQNPLEVEHGTHKTYLFVLDILQMGKI